MLLTIVVLLMVLNAQVALVLITGLKHDARFERYMRMLVSDDEKSEV